VGHTYSYLLVHVIFSTKDREPLIESSWRDRLYEYMAGIARNEFGHAVRIGGVEDHLHGLIRIRTDVSVATAMNRWKSLSSGWVNNTIKPALRFAWQTGYAAFSVSRSNEDQVVQYIDGQEAHHKTVTFRDELMAFLERHGIESIHGDMLD